MLGWLNQWYWNEYNRLSQPSYCRTVALGGLCDVLHEDEDDDGDGANGKNGKTWWIAERGGTTDEGSTYRASNDDWRSREWVCYGDQGSKDMR
jgi:hypothetical protein